MRLALNSVIMWSVKHMATLANPSVCTSGADLFLEHHVTALYRRGSSWEVERKAGGSETFDAVILTMPMPQILQLQGDVGKRETLAHETETETDTKTKRGLSELNYHDDCGRVRNLAV